MYDNYDFVNVRSAAILTGAFVAGNIIGSRSDSGYVMGNPSKYNQMVIYVDFTIGSLTDGQIKVEFSHDNSTYYAEGFNSISAGVATESTATHKFTATGKYSIAIPISAQYIKISAFGNGTTTGSSMKIDAVLSRV